MKKGFTLIELMVVVVIIGILAAIAIPNFVRVIDKAKVASVQANMHAVQVAVEEMNVDLRGSYPTVENDIEARLPQNMKNPYIATDQIAEIFEITTGANGPVYSGSAGHVMYATDGTDSDGTLYWITGTGKDATHLDLILVPGTEQ